MKNQAFLNIKYIKLKKRVFSQKSNKLWNYTTCCIIVAKRE